MAVFWQLCGLARTKYKGCVRVLTTNQGIPAGTVQLNKWLPREWGAVKYRSFLLYKLPGFFMLECVREVFKSDAVYLVSTFYPPVFLSFLVAKIFRKAIIWAPHGSIEDRELVKNAGLKRIYLRLIRRLAKDVTFHTTCENETEAVRRHFGPEVKVLTITNYMVLPERLERKKEDYLLFIGRFGVNKGIDNLLRGIAASGRFLKSGFRLKLVGDFDNSYGYEMIDLAQTLDLAPRVDFLGHKKGEEKQEILAKARFLLMPSYNENFGIVVAEALAQGTPAVASIYTPWKVLEEYSAGFWVDNTPESLGRVIDRIISMSPGEYAAYCAQSLELACNELDVIKNAQKWETAYQNLEAGRV